MNDRNIAPRFALFSLMMSTLLLQAAPADASEDAKRWSGAICAPYGTTPQTDYAIRAEGIQNVASDGYSKWVVCPLTRDSEVAYNAQGSAYVEIRGTRPASGKVDCMLTKGNSSMGPMETNVETASYANGDWVVLFTSAMLYSNMAATIVVSCRLPPQAGLSHLRYSETTSTQN